MKSVKHQRHGERYPVSEHGLLISQDGMHDPIEVHVTDVSRQGVGFVAHTFFAIRDRYILRYNFPQREYNMVVNIKWSQYVPWGYYAGCKKIAEIRE